MQPVLLNLSDEIVTSMRKMGFREESITELTQKDSFKEALNKDANIQRVALTMTFYDLLMYQPKTIPTNVRVALSIAVTASHWLDDIISTVLPFIRVNEDEFFSKVA